MVHSRDPSQYHLYMFAPDFRRTSLDSFDAASTSSRDAVTLPSGRMFYPDRSRWDGPLDREEYEYCREHGVRLSYDCAQIGWVTQTCIDESGGLPQQPMVPGEAAEVRTLDSEERTLELRGVVEFEAAGILEDVQQGRMSPAAAQQRLAMVAAAALKEVTKEFGLSDWDLAHWVLEVAAANALRAIREPLHQRQAVFESTAFAFRSWTPDDAGVYTELLGNPRIWEYMPEPFPSEFTVDTARTLIEVGSIGFHHDTVAIEVDGRPIGQCRLRFDRHFAGTRVAEVAYWLGEEHWRQGWMSRVLPAFTYRSFRQHSVDVIYAWIMKDNEASIRAAERAGYRRARFPLETQLADSLRRPGFVRYATYRVDWVTDADQTP
jgi:RimJ/RimL family protein N-acetyltransferase